MLAKFLNTLTSLDARIAEIAYPQGYALGHASKRMIFVGSAVRAPSRRTRKGSPNRIAITAEVATATTKPARHGDTPRDG